MYDMFDIKLLKAFLKNQSGAVTVDFVVLTAGIVTLGVVATSGLGPKVTAFIATIIL